MLNTKEIEHSIDSPLTKGVAPAKPEMGVVQLLKDADAHADCKAELIFYDSHGYPSVTYKLTGKMVRKLVNNNILMNKK